MKIYGKVTSIDKFGEHIDCMEIDCPGKTVEEIKQAYYNKYQNRYGVRTEWLDERDFNLRLFVEELNEYCFDNSEEARIERAHAHPY